MDIAELKLALAKPERANTAADSEDALLSATVGLWKDVP